MDDKNITCFGRTLQGEEVSLIRLDNGTLSCEVLSFGASLRALWVKDNAGVYRDIVLGYDSLREYEMHDAYLGATVGRYANRIARGKFMLNEKEYNLAVNNGPNHLHGGLIGFSHRVWNVEQAGKNFVKLSLFSPDGEESYPGNMNVFVTYTLRENSLIIKYEADSDADTVCNLTNHSYFNLAGQNAGSVLEQEIMLNAQYYTPTDADSIPSGELAPVCDTPMDLRRFTKIGEHIDSDFIQLVQGRGYDHNYVVDGEPGQLRKAATVRCKESGVVMQLYTTHPGVQLYTANYIDEGRPGKSGAVYGPRHAFCLETQHFPDSPNHPEFPTTVLKAGEKYEQTAEFRFSII